MTGYTIYYSDPAKNNNPIFVADNTKNSRSTSLTLIGRNYPGYGQAIGEDLVHLLENFAGSAPPNNPIEGQLWFDTSDPNNKKLRINDGGVSGAKWSPINGIFQQPERPGDAKLGDIWVDTANQQLKFYNGLDFTLVGPTYSSATRTGSYTSQWTDTLGEVHDIIIQYVNDNPVEIIAKELFTPNPIIDGFTVLNPGVNISSYYSKIYGIADSASSLQISIPASQKVSADNFMRKDIPQSAKGSLQILVDGNALQIGTDPTFVLERRSGYNAVFSNLDAQGQYSFEVANIPIVTIDGPTRRVRINSSATNSATAGLEIFGSVRTSSSATFNTLYVTSTDANFDQVPGNALQVVGGAGIGGTLVVYGEHILKGPLLIGESSPAVSTVTSILLPAQDRIYDNGSPTARWRNVYGDVFLSTGTAARFVGIATFATAFSSPSPVSITGDITSVPVNFSGNGSALTLNSTASAGLINNRTESETSTASSYILFTSNSQIYKQKKRDFLKDINYQDSVDLTVNPGYTTPAGSLVPIGTILPWAGESNEIPPGWVLCDGTELPSDSKYQNLKNIIKQKYDPAGLAFLTPNLTSALSAGAVPINYIIKY